MPALSLNGASRHPSLVMRRASQQCGRRQRISGGVKRGLIFARGVRNRGGGLIVLKIYAVGERGENILC